jgi:electron transfer flavoprotein beta subunit
LSLAGAINIEADAIRVERVFEEGRMAVKAKLPAVLSVVQSIGEPRYPSFMGIRRASKAEIPLWSLADLGIAAPAPIVNRVALVSPPAREVNCEMITGGSPQEIAETLVDKILAEKVL